ncbi:MAG TPA: formate dehydrogenase accessory sulfurtransferase FdhD [Steroidobacteraceae bacterium]|nr:formate dehydrogenase accessory sulfurtransferase FdhD [Steroidobacteraceae bacterium]
MPGNLLPGIVELPVRRWRDGAWEQASDAVADEVPVALTFNSIPHVVMLATPADLADLGRGFSFTEALVESPEEIRAVELRSSEQGLEVALSVPQQRLAQLLDRRRNLTGRTGCGVCGAETIEDAIRVPAPVAPGGQIRREVLVDALAALRSRQVLNAKTGSLHAAAWVGWAGDIRVVREDVGRHNALDKVIGALLAQRAHRDDGLLVVTSRASYEMVQKAATAGVRMLVAVSAPTALAIRLAESTGLTLVGFARESQQVVYTHPERLA